MKNPASNEQLQRFMSKMECQAISDDEDEDVSTKSESTSVDNEKEVEKEKNGSLKKGIASDVQELQDENIELIDITKDDEGIDPQTRERYSSLSSMVFNEPELLMTTQIPLEYNVCSSMENFPHLKMETKILKSFHECRKPSFCTGITNSLCFSIDGRFLFIADDNNIGRVIDVHSWKVQRIISFNKYGIYNGQFLQHNYDILHPSYKTSYSIRQYSLEYNKYTRFYHGHEDGIIKLSLSPAGTFFMTSSADGTIKLWDVRIPSSCSTISGFANPKISYDATGNYIGVVDDTYVVKFFDIRSYNRGVLKKFIVNDEILNANNKVRDIQFSPNGKAFILPTNGCSFASYDVITGGKVANYENINNWGNLHYPVEFSPCSSKIFVSCDNELNMYNVNTGFLHKTFISQHRNGISQMKFFNNAMMLATSGDGVSLWTPDYAKIEEFKKDEEKRNQIKYKIFVSDMKKASSKQTKETTVENIYENYTMLGPLYIDIGKQYQSVDNVINNNETNRQIKEEVEEEIIVKTEAHANENCGENDNNQIEKIEKGYNMKPRIRKVKKIRKIIRKTKVKKEESKIFEDVDMISDDDDDEEEFEEIEIDEEVSEYESMEEDN